MKGTEMTKIIFMGTPEFSATILKGLLEDNRYTVLAVVTQPDRAVGRKKEIKETPVKTLALDYQLPVYQPEKLSSSKEMLDLMNLGADGIVTAAFGQFLPTKLLNSVDFAINVHASLLPKYRGGAPIHYAILNGEHETGVTIMEMVKQMDAGPIIAKSSVPITNEDNVGTLFEKLAIVGCQLLLKTLPSYISGDIIPKPQEESQATFSPNITPNLECIDWTKSSWDVFNHIRGLSPWPVAHTFLNGKRFKIYEAILAEGHGNPGEIIGKDKKSLIISTGDGAISLKTVQLAGKPRMSISDFLNGIGQKLNIGDVIGK